MMRRVMNWCVTGLLVVLPVITFAQTVPAAGADSQSNTLERVTVIGTSVGDDRRDATAAKTVVTREAIVRYGDANLADVLRRVPGLTVTKSRGDGSSIRMRGLGEGYTQLMINGEPALPGTTIESISPDLIERIEVIRTATADQSAQAIAGTINVILKRSSRRRDRGVKLGVSSKNGLLSGQASTEYGEQTDEGGWSIAANVGVDRDRWPSTTEQAASDAQGAPLYSRLTSTDDSSTKSTVGLTANSLWKWSEARSLNLNGFVQAQHSKLEEFERRKIQFGSPPQFGGDSLALPSDTLLARLVGTLKLDWNEAGRLEQKLSTSLTRTNSDGLRAFYDDPNQHILDRRVVGRLKDINGIWTGKYSRLLQDEHVLEVGWDSQITRRQEERRQTETSAVGYPTTDFDQSYQARISRLAIYAQDEVSLANGVAVYGGLRWEGLHTQVLGNDATKVSQQSSVFSPTLQVLWKLPGSKSDQLRFSLGRTYRTPATKDLIPRRWQTPDNSPTTPDFQGNSALQPELAWAVDMGYEHYFSDRGFIGLAVYAKRIDNVILQQLFEIDGRWVTSPYNAGQATASGVEIEAKATFQDLLAGAPDGDLRLSLGRNWSRVDSIPGFGNRLDQQVPFTLSLGIDYRPTNQITLGIGYVYNRGAYTRKSLTQSTTTADSHSFDLYSLWKITKDTQVRTTISRVAGPDDRLRDNYTDQSLNLQQVMRSPRQYIFKLQLSQSF
jgi:outer membrane receptor for ferrienterochelin and colicins